MGTTGAEVAAEEEGNGRPGEEVIVRLQQWLLLQQPTLSAPLQTMEHQHHQRAMRQSSQGVDAGAPRHVPVEGATPRAPVAEPAQRKLSAAEQELLAY